MMSLIVLMRSRVPRDDKSCGVVGSWTAGKKERIAGQAVLKERGNDNAREKVARLRVVVMVDCLSLSASLNLLHSGPSSGERSEVVNIWTRTSGGSLLKHHEPHQQEVVSNRR